MIIKLASPQVHNHSALDQRGLRLYSHTIAAVTPAQ